MGPLNFDIISGSPPETKNTTLMATQQNSKLNSKNSKLNSKKSGKTRKPRKLTTTNNPRYINKFLTDYTGRKHATWKEYSRAQARPNHIRVEQENRERKEREAYFAQKLLREQEQDKEYASSHPMKIYTEETLWSRIEVELGL